MKMNFNFKENKSASLLVILLFFYVISIYFSPNLNLLISIVFPFVLITASYQLTVKKCKPSQERAIACLFGFFFLIYLFFLFSFYSWYGGMLDLFFPIAILILSFRYTRKRLKESTILTRVEKILLRSLRYTLLLIFTSQIVVVFPMGIFYLYQEFVVPSSHTQISPDGQTIGRLTIGENLIAERPNSGFANFRTAPIWFPLIEKEVSGQKKIYYSQKTSFRWENDHILIVDPANKNTIININQETSNIAYKSYFMIILAVLEIIEI